MSQSQNIPIEPSTETTIKIITSFIVNITNVQLFTSVSVNAMLYGSDGTFQSVKNITFSGQDYLDWNNDDQYIINKTAEKLGFIIESTVPIVPN